MNTLSTGIPQCLEVLAKAKTIIITTHQNPDGDAIGSALGLYHFAVNRGIKATIINFSPTPTNLQFLPSAHGIEVYTPEAHDALIAAADAICILDLNSINRIQTMGDAVLSSPAVKVLIDHHQNPTIDAGVMVVDTDSTSTCELIFRIIDASGLGFSPESATAIYTGIMTDTGGFRYPRTDAEVFQMASRLLEYGADPVAIAENVFNSSPFSRTVLLGKALGSLTLSYDGKLSVMTVTADDFLQTNALEEDTEGFVSHTLSITGVVMGILFVEFPGKNAIKISIRSKGDVRANDLAGEINGGGHLNAAAGRIYNRSLEEVRSEVVEKAGKYMV